MTEQDILKQLQEAEAAFQEASRLMVEARKKLLDAETHLIEAKLKREGVKESLRVFRNTTPKVDPSRRDREIEKFREDYPEVCEFAKERDRNRP